MATVYERKTGVFQIVMLLLFAFVILVTLLPILNILALSFSEKDAILTGRVGLLPIGFNVDAYRMVFNDASMIRAFTFSLFLMALQLVLSMAATILGAYPLSKAGLPGRRALMIVIIITMYFSAGVIPSYILYKDLKLLNTIWVLLAPSLISAFNLIILRTFFSSINISLYEAAYMDGCSEFRALWAITLPLSKAAIMTLSMFYAVERWNTVSDIILFIQEPKLYTLQYKLKLMLDVISIPHEAGVVTTITPENFKSACIVFTMIPMLIIYPFVQKYFRDGVMIGSVKG
ncbi:MAG: carbohydrate ABC transporter permease [Sphaerochaeta sp.]|jgi:putative aldouronate transport system permease protein|nr:carbohydrate ABC transporter permease [Sphaerochaeta sp.]